MAEEQDTKPAATIEAVQALVEATRALQERVKPVEAPEAPVEAPEEPPVVAAPEPAKEPESPPEEPATPIEEPTSAPEPAKAAPPPPAAEPQDINALIGQAVEKAVAATLAAVKAATPEPEKAPPISTDAQRAAFRERIVGTPSEKAKPADDFLSRLRAKLPD